MRDQQCRGLANRQCARNACNLDKSVYYKPLERYGRTAILAYGGDRLQLPPVPESSGLLVSMENVTNEHPVGASIFRNAEPGFSSPDRDAVH